MLIHTKPYHHYLAISVSYKADLWNLLEFIEYHRIVGVSHFFICNNDDNTKESSRILRHYAERGIVTNIPTAKKFRNSKNRQQSGHHMCLQLARIKKIKWLALLDIDEFIFPLQKDNVPDVLKHYEDCREVAFNYRCFGSSGYRWRPELQTKAYLRCAHQNWGWNKLCKSIGQVNMIPSVKHHHFFDGHKMVDEDKEFCGWVKDYKGGVMRINHYMARSEEDYMEKMRRGNPLGEKRTWNWFRWANRNEVYDDSMLRFVEPLRNALLERIDLLKLSRRQIALL
jgi:hypothetical protein